MTNIVSADAIDAAFDFIADGSEELHVCSGQPTTRAAAVSNSLASVAVSSADFSKANGDVSGRKQTLQQKNILAASASGLAHCVALIDGSKLYRVVKLVADQAVTVGNPVTVSAHSHEIRDPA